MFNGSKISVFEEGDNTDNAQLTITKKIAIDYGTTTWA